MPGSNVISFESFRSERDRRRAEPHDPVCAATLGTPFRERLASVLGPRQIAHRRAMLDFSRQVREPRLDAIRAGARVRE